MLQLRVSVMIEKDIYEYLRLKYENTFNRQFPQDRIKDMAILRRLKKVYGPIAGEMVKWVFYHYAGLVNGRPVTVVDFSSYNATYTDRIYNEVLAEKLKDADAIPGLKEVLKSSQPISADELLKW